jgi:hypothetical protein
MADFIWSREWFSSTKTSSLVTAGGREDGRIADEDAAEVRPVGDGGEAAGAWVPILVDGDAGGGEAEVTRAPACEQAARMQTSAVPVAVRIIRPLLERCASTRELSGAL